MTHLSLIVTLFHSLNSNSSKSSKQTYLWFILPVSLWPFTRWSCVQVRREPRRPALTAVQCGEVIPVLVILTYGGTLNPTGWPIPVEIVYTGREIPYVSMRNRVECADSKQIKRVFHCENIPGKNVQRRSPAVSLEGYSCRGVAY